MISESLGWLRCIPCIPWQLVLVIVAVEKYSRLMCMVWSQVVFRYLTYYRPGSASRQDGNSIGQHGKCVRQAIETHYRAVSRWSEPWSRYRAGWVSEISNMFDISQIYQSKAGNTNDPNQILLLTLRKSIVPDKTAPVEHPH